MRILGIDPGSRLTGYGCIETDGRKLALLSHGTIFLHSQMRADESEDLGHSEMSLRLHLLHKKLTEIIIE